jgi:integrase/recombinase XerD
MKKLKLKNTSYKALVINYKEWLDILGFAEKSVHRYPVFLQEFFYYLEQHHINSIENITRVIVQNYYKQLQQRPNERRSGALSKSSLNSHQNALRKFKEYLQKHSAKNIAIHLKPERINRLEIINILTQEEAKELFKATEFSSPYKHIQQRDKAMLVLLYSCGLRRNEAVTLNIKDVLFDKEILHVRKGKNYKERLVPINSYNLEILEAYIYDARIQFKNYRESEALLIGNYGTRLQGNTLAGRLREIVKATNNQEIIDKQISPHRLRHSIATHFLEAGMNIEDIKQFLGHSHLETTQIYTHLIKKL